MVTHVLAETRSMVHFLVIIERCMQSSRSAVAKEREKKSCLALNFGNNPGLVLRQQASVYLSGHKAAVLYSGV